ncbi:hypothetical protein Taro_052754 [Colocasia esculenta]|uniref:HTH myb-type domain-containing protein n=1 Tax=Colocasia esculenta TaxID=4460 RepID=A0A843XL08_COLES|nr:hypothetical protein [Colocasia esculenta]
MGSPSELSLDYRPNGYSTALKPFGDQTDQTQKLEEFLSRLEEERLKIEAFKRELPLCMQLLNNAMEAYRQQLEMYHNTNQGTRPVLEEFIPLKHASTTSEGSEKIPEANDASSEKTGWMTSAQLWSPPDGAMQPAAPQGDANTFFNVGPTAVLDNKQRHGGAFLPFTKERSGRGRGVVPELALAPMEKEKGENKLLDVEAARRPETCSKGAHDQVGKPVTNGASDGGGQTAAQNHRKARRCWTPELHRRFVNALQMLGGSQVATPKQIRELMKVDGLTNDEVKSHLQKYRLHTRRPIPAPTAAASAVTPQLLVLGGIWVPPEYAATATAAGGPVIYGGHPAAAAHFCAPPPVQQDFYSPSVQQIAYQSPLLQHHHDNAVSAAATAPSAYMVKNGLPESEVRRRQATSESIENGEEETEGDDEVEEEEEEEGRQSESSSWKEGDEKAVDMHVSNSSAMVRKF